MKKPALPSIIAALAFATATSPAIVQAKSIKGHCVALDPGNPSVQTCYSSTSRPLTTMPITDPIRGRQPPPGALPNEHRGVSR